MGQIKNIKLHIVTDIKVTLKSVVSCYTAKVQTEQLTLTKWPIFQLLSLLVCTVLSFCMMTISTSLVKRWPKSYLLQVNVEAFWPGLFAKALQGRNIGDLICNVGSAPAAGGAAPAAAAAGGDAPAAEEKKEEAKKEESESGSDDDMGFGLFD